MRLDFRGAASGSSAAGAVRRASWERKGENLSAGDPVFRDTCGGVCGCWTPLPAGIVSAPRSEVAEIAASPGNTRRREGHGEEIPAAWSGPVVSCAGQGRSQRHGRE